MFERFNAEEAEEYYKWLITMMDEFRSVTQYMETI